MSKYSLLLIDGDPDVLESVARFCTARDHEVYRATSGEEGLALDVRPTAEVSDLAGLAYWLERGAGEPR